MFKKIQNYFYKLYLFNIYYLFIPFLHKKFSFILKHTGKNLNIDKSGHEEQALPGFSKYRKSGYYRYMFGRYLLSFPFIKNKTVLDCACGLGWGAYLIADLPKKLLAIDINDRALSFAKATWHEEKIIFKNNSVLSLSSLNNYFDVILAYEIIEHLDKKESLLFLQQAHKTLKEKGKIIISSTFPNCKTKAETLRKINLYHKHIYTKDEIKYVLKKTDFKIIRSMGQLIVIAEKI